MLYPNLDGGIYFTIGNSYQVTYDSYLIVFFSQIKKWRQLCTLRPMIAVFWT